MYRPDQKSAVFIFVFALILFNSCSTTKYVPQDEYLLKDYKIKGTTRQINDDEIAGYVRQKPNKKILGFKFYLGLYNLSNKEKDNWFNNYLRTIGEEPVIYDPILTSKTTDQLELYLRNKGFYNARVSDTVLFQKKKAHVVYEIEANEPYRLRKIRYEFEDTSLRKWIYADTSNTLLHTGNLFDVDVLSAERERLEEYLKTKGFYAFIKEYIFYEADTSVNEHKVDVNLVFKKYREFNEDGSYEEMPHPRYKIRNVYLNTNYKPRLALAKSSEYFNSLDTLALDSTFFIYSGKQNVNPGIITESNYIIPGNFYDITNVRRSYRNLNSLRIFRLVTIEFEEAKLSGDSSIRELDCFILLTPQTLQSFTVELEGTNSSGNIGAAGNLIYQHRNLFKNAENLDVRLKGALETLKESYSSDYGNMIEYGAELRFNIPKFLLPFRTDQFIKKYNPSTSISLAYNYQQRPDYTRTLANASFGYLWKGNRYLTHIVNPVELNLVQIPFKSQSFIDWLEGKYIAYSYQPHMVSVSSYSLIFNNQNLQKKTDFSYLRFNVESAGNLLYTVYNLSDLQADQDNYTVFNTEFAQYVKGDIDLRYYNIINDNSSLVYRFFAGAGLPYKNSNALPFEKKYFAGGANGIRAWQVRNLGPGSYFEPEESSPYPNKTADIKLEANLEYRFELFWLLEGALFLDAGNIWAITENDERAGALFAWDRFYKEIAVGTGFGTRFVFSFFTFRVDLGMKLRDPALPLNERWIIGTRPLHRQDFTVNIGIGYPF